MLQMNLFAGQDRDADVENRRGHDWGRGGLGESGDWA